MPWTFAHPAAVLPLRRLPGLSFAGLVMGSMSPDFGYYVGQFDAAGFAHTLPGLWLVCLPAGLLMLFLARWLKVPVAHLLPRPHRQVLLGVQPQPLGLRSLGMAAACVLLGAVTHVVWDAFTHEGRFFVEHVDALRQPLFTAFNREFRVFNVVQHVSTVLGCVLLLLAYRRHAAALKLEAADERRRYAALAGIAAAALVCAAPWAWADAMSAEARLFVSTLLVREVVYATTAFFVILSIAAIWRAHRPAAEPL